MTFWCMCLDPRIWFRVLLGADLVPMPGVRVFGYLAVHARASLQQISTVKLYRRILLNLYEIENRSTSLVKKELRNATTREVFNGCHMTLQ